MNKPSDGRPKYLVVNADEGEPGTCKVIFFLSWLDDNGLFRRLLYKNEIKTENEKGHTTVPYETNWRSMFFCNYLALPLVLLSYTSELYTQLSLLL